ncbi:butyrophilin subfamily 2 member A1-like isoform X1 [Podarcis lilfordi]|uniref:Butyrophilin subfamily 2 member A1-like isoform X1 n=1 Tax=Podarcis lilfordi TaxID=74358 RepID=A0AA35L6N5_9SAUR|nr:butyrophilin subfamily 2 member A1-like isoform X1 [Podarcis lilfordi]
MNIILLLGAVLTNSRNSAIHLLPFLIMSYSATGNSTSPLIVLDQYEGSGIRLVCKSENVRSPELLQLSWMDGKGQELSATPTTLGKSSIENSVLLEWGSGSAVSCRITSKSSNTPIGSTSLVIADIFFPSTSLCMVGFFVIAILIINVIIFTYLKLNHDRRKIAFSEKAKLQWELAKVKEETGKEFKKVQEKFAKAEHELEFRRALSCAVDVTLDPKCTHAKLIIKEKNKVKYNHSLLEQLKDPKGPLIAVANEGYSGGEMYWEVEVGHKCEWELGVITITARKRLEEEKLEKPLEEGYIGIRWFQGKFHCTGGNSLTDGQNEECEVVGVFLDVNGKVLSFYNVQKMCPIRLIPYRFSEEMYPFFNPGSDDKFLKVRPISIPKCLISL